MANFNILEVCYFGFVEKCKKKYKEFNNCDIANKKENCGNCDIHKKLRDLIEARSDD